MTVSVAATGEDEPAGMLVGEMVATTPVGRLPPRVSAMGPVYPLRRETDTANVAVDPGATATDAGVTPTEMPGDDWVETTMVSSRVRFVEPLVPVTVKDCEPSGVEADVATVRVLDPVPGPTAHLRGGEGGGGAAGELGGGEGDLAAEPADRGDREREGRGLAALDALADRLRRDGEVLGGRRGERDVDAREPADEEDPDERHEHHQGCCPGHDACTHGSPPAVGRLPGT